ncbi:MAG TPA: DUF4234 domain-containing protein [Blastocatellia bacterium]|nr:DUF4234 domain-containing protein [Blastocatellia bacterium]
MNCPSCGAPNRDTSRFCSKCGGTLTATAEPPSNPNLGASYPSVYQQPGMSTPPPNMGMQPANSGLPYAPAPSGTIGFERSIATSIILTLVTCGIYGLVWFYAVGKDIRDYLGRGDPNPGMDILLMIVTCGIWGLYIMYKYPTQINEMLQKRGLPTNDNLPLISIILGVCGLGIVSLAMMQSELNKLWQSPQR